jgi:hypothetical protein
MGVSKIGQMPTHTQPIPTEVEIAIAKFKIYKSACTYQNPAEPIQVDGETLYP